MTTQERFEPIVSDERLDVLPGSMQKAQRAVANPEVQDIIKKLAEYNLGVCMPHMHITEGKFVKLPTGTISLEKESEFIPESEADSSNTLPVAWRWKDGSVIVAGSCHVIRKRCGS